MLGLSKVHSAAMKSLHPVWEVSSYPMTHVDRARISVSLLIPAVSVAESGAEMEGHRHKLFLSIFFPFHAPFLLSTCKPETAHIE